MEKAQTMTLSKQIETNFRALYFGGNWTWSDVKTQLEGITWEQATTQVHSFNTIATLTFHMGYYVDAVLNVLRGTPLTSSDKESFLHPPIHSQEDWEQLVTKTFADAEQFAELVAQLPEEKWWETFAHEKYGNYYRNIHGVIEHTHYHLGQIALIKKLVQQNGEK